METAMILRPMKRMLAATVFLLAGCQAAETPGPAKQVSTPPPAQVVVSHQADIEAWQKDRDQRLRKDDSWLTLVGLNWLNEGENLVGSDRAGKVVLPAKAPAKVGTLTLGKGTVTLTPAAKSGLLIGGKPLAGPTVLQNDTWQDGPTIVKLGSVQFYVIKRQGDRYGVRIKDSESAARVKFTGLEYFSIDPKWRVEARFEPYKPARQIPITDITGVTANQPAPGALVFEIDGRTHRLDPIAEEGSSDLFVIFKDGTSRDSTTYPAGRYVYAKPAGPDGKVILDFNKAYNPPCVFTPFATCPLPPAQNHLPVRVEAGEKNFHAVVVGSARGV